MSPPHVKEPLPTDPDLTHLSRYFSGLEGRNTFSKKVTIWWCSVWETMFEGSRLHPGKFFSSSKTQPHITPEFWCRTTFWNLRHLINREACKCSWLNPDCLESVSFIAIPGLVQNMCFCNYRLCNPENENPKSSHSKIWNFWHARMRSQMGNSTPDPMGGVTAQA